MSESDKVRQFVAEQYVRPARQRGERTFTVIVGHVHRKLGFRNRVPLVCAALKSNRFLHENQLLLKHIQGPPSGMSTTVALTYELERSGADGVRIQNPLWALLGEAKKMFQQLGGGEVFIQGERQELNRVGGASSDSPERK
jgi:hypothetical protein